METSSQTSLSLIFSIFNEEKNIPLLTEKILKNIPIRSELIFIDDGSTDKSDKEIEAAVHFLGEYQVVKINHLVNEGHEQAMRSGLHAAGGDFVIFMDADMQHPLESIPEILNLHEKGAQIVFLYAKVEVIISLETFYLACSHTF